MRAIVLKGVNINDTSAPVIDIDPERRAVASIPGLVTVFEPNGQNFNTISGSLFDIQNASWWSGPTNVKDNPLTTLNGVEAIDASKVTGSWTSESIKYNRSEGTMFAVVKIPETPCTLFGTRTGEAMTGGINFGVGGSGLLTWYISTTDNNTPPAGRDSNTDYRGKTVLVMATYNSEAGRKAFVNGTQVINTGSNLSGYVGDIVNDEISFFAKNTATNPFTGLDGAIIGHFGLLNIDISKPIYAKRKKVLEDWLMDMYGLK